MNRELTYIACPYSHEDWNIMLYRFNEVTKLAGELLKEGRIVYSPITHSHPRSIASDLPVTFPFWERIDRVFLSYSKELVVLTLDGWESSSGVLAEIDIANEMHINIEYKPVKE